MIMGEHRLDGGHLVLSIAILTKDGYFSLSKSNERLRARDDMTE